MEYTEMDKLNDNIRELKDENSRLLKLLKEKDLEVNLLNDKLLQESNSVKNIVTNDVASIKIIELSKKVREALAQLESEKTKNKQLCKKYTELELKCVKEDGDNSGSKTNINAELESKKMVAEEKSLTEKLAHCESKLTDYRNQIQSLNNELKLAHKILTQEIGTPVNLQSLLNTPGGWKGRSQQILILQKKITDLKKQFSDNVSSPGSCISFNEPEMHSIRNEQKQIDHIKKIENKKFQEVEKLSNDYTQLLNDFDSLKKSSEGTKARLKTLSSENRLFKEQLSILIEKGQHDDELINLLLTNQDKLQVIRNKLNKNEKN